MNSVWNIFSYPCAEYFGRTGLPYRTGKYQKSMEIHDFDRKVDAHPDEGEVLTAYVIRKRQQQYEDEGEY